MTVSRGLVAALPILVVIVAMLALRRSAAAAGLAALVAAGLLAVGVFGYGDAIYPELGAAAATAGALAEAGFSSLVILWIILPALAIHHLQEHTGALAVLRGALARITGDPRLVALLVAWFFALFLEGAAGFGTPVALTAPFLVGAGFRPVQAVVLALLGHAVGVSFGAVGTPVLPQWQATGIDRVALSAATGELHAAVGWIMPLILVRMVTRDAGGEHRGPPPWGWALCAAGLFLLPQLAISRWVGPELPTLGGALTGGVAFALLVRRLGPRGLPLAGDPAMPGGGTALARAAAPYLLVLAFVLLTRLVPAISAATGAVEWSWTLGGRFSGTMLPLYHPGTLLMLGFLATALLRRTPSGEVARALATALRQLAPVAVALFAMLALSRLMVHAGMIDAMAGTAAGAAGRGWPLLTPFVGVLGTFVTGSATASNILFTEFQVSAAEQTGMPVLRALGAQGYGAAIGNTIAPHNVIAGAATVGLTGREAEVLRRTIGPCLLYATLGGLLVLALG
jgi:lactate permease